VIESPVLTAISNAETKPYGFGGPESPPSENRGELPGLQGQNPHSNVAKGATLEWGTRRVF